MTDSYTKTRWDRDENLLENGEHEQNLEKPMQITFKRNRRRKKEIIVLRVLEEKMYAFKHGIRTKNIGIQA